MLISIKKKNYIAGPHFEDIENSALLQQLFKQRG